MISSYRLGDLVILQLNDTEKNELLSEYPESIGSKYIMSRMNDNPNIIKTKIFVCYLAYHRYWLKDYLILI